MSEPSSALFLIADDGEFRFARFYSVYEGVQVRAARKSAHCLWCAGHVPVGLSKRGRDTESDADIQPEEMLTFFSNEFPSAFPSEISRSDLLIILLINAKHGMFIAAVPFYPFITGEMTGFPSRSRSGVIPPAYPLA